MSEDPLGLDSGDYNLYRYVNNQPSMKTDPSGEIGLVGFAIGFGAELAIQMASNAYEGKDMFSDNNYDYQDMFISGTVGAVGPGLFTSLPKLWGKVKAVKTLNDQLSRAKTINKVTKISNRIAKNKKDGADLATRLAAFQLLKKKLKQTNDQEGDCE